MDLLVVDLGMPREPVLDVQSVGERPHQPSVEHLLTEVVEARFRERRADEDLEPVAPCVSAEVLQPGFGSGARHQLVDTSHRARRRHPCSIRSGGIERSIIPFAVSSSQVYRTIACCSTGNDMSAVTRDGRERRHQRLAVNRLGPAVLGLEDHPHILLRAAPSDGATAHPPPGPGRAHRRRRTGSPRCTSASRRRVADRRCIRTRARSGTPTTARRAPRTWPTDGRPAGGSGGHRRARRERRRRRATRPVMRNSCS